MRVITDLHVHSRFARAVSKDMHLATLEEWGIKKGVEIIGTGDFTHPDWFRELKAELEEAESGLYQRQGSTTPIRFVLTSEIACIFSRRGGTRRIHILVVAPSTAVVEEINAHLGWIGNLKADGRPMLGLDIKELATICRKASPDCLLIPAHVWTPWFGMYGSKSGFDSFADCFEDLADLIPAVETGLSSDPTMNWRLSELDTKCIVSFSDAHSAPNIGREATIVELAEKNFSSLSAAFRVPFPTAADPNRIVMTVEFFPEEGMYHWDGHRNHNVRWSPEETKQHKGLCTVCGQPVTVGVMHRVDTLADRSENATPPGRPPFRRLVPLAEILGEALGVGKLTKTVQVEYEELIAQLGSEFNVLLNAPLEQLQRITKPRIAEGIERVRNEKLQIIPGYDGVYGTVHVFTEEERKAEPTGQSSLF